MTQLTTKKRVAAVGMAGALALGTVVSTGALTSAQAADTVYTCTLSVGDTPLPVSTTITFAATTPAGASLAGIPATLGVTLPAPLVAALGGAIPGMQSIGGSASGVALPVAGGTAIPLNNLTIPQSMPGLDGSLPLSGSTTTGAAKAPLTVGDHDVTMPSEFTFSPVAMVGGAPLPLGPIPCKTATPASVGTLHVVKASSKTTAKVTNTPITHTKRAKLAVKVASTATRTGTVVVKEGSKTLAKKALSGGKATVTLPRLKKGIHKLVVKYGGDANTEASKTPVKVTVKR